MEIEIMSEGGNLFGKMLNKYRAIRSLAISDAMVKLKQRHEITSQKENQYKIEEHTVVMPSGDEVIELRLYQLVDAAIVTVEGDVTTSLQGGIKNLREFRQ